MGRAVMDRLTHQTSLSHKADSGLMQVLQIFSPIVSKLRVSLIVLTLLMLLCAISF